MRIISLILALTMCVYFAGCGKKSKVETDSSKNNTEQVSKENLKEDGQEKETGQQPETEQSKAPELQPEKDVAENNDVNQNATEAPSKEELDIFNSYLKQIEADSDKPEEEIQKEIAESKGMTPEEVKKIYLKVWQYKLEQAEKMSQ